MTVILIIFVIIFIIIKLWRNYLENDLLANIKFHAKGGNWILGLLTICEYILGAIIFVKILLKIFN